MQLSDVNRRVVYYDLPLGQGNGICGIIVSVYDAFTFRLRTDKNTEYECNTSPRTDGSFTPWVKFIDNQERV